MELTRPIQREDVDIVLTPPGGFQIDIDDALIEEPVENVFASSHTADAERA